MIEVAAALDRAGELTPEQFGHWVAPHVPAMARLASRMTSSSERDDIVQEALSRAWTRRSTFDPNRGTAAAWLLAITADQAGRAWRRRRPLIGLLPSRIQPIDETIDLELAVARLPERQRLVIDCVYFVGLSVAETAGVMGRSEGTVKSTLHDARKHLRALLETE
jgi:RNA polymerase sigma factor (sigma-70 family)